MNGSLKMSETQGCSVCGHKISFIEAYGKIINTQRKLGGEPILYYKCPGCLNNVRIQAELIVH